MDSSGLRDILLQLINCERDYSSQLLRAIWGVRAAHYEYKLWDVYNGDIWHFFCNLDKPALQELDSYVSGG